MWQKIVTTWLKQTLLYFSNQHAVCANERLRKILFPSLGWLGFKMLDNTSLSMTFMKYWRDHIHCVTLLTILSNYTAKFWWSEDHWILLATRFTRKMTRKPNWARIFGSIGTLWISITYSKRCKRKRGAPEYREKTHYLYTKIGGKRWIIFIVYFHMPFSFCRQ